MNDIVVVTFAMILISFISILGIFVELQGLQTCKATIVYGKTDILIRDCLVNESPLTLVQAGLQSQRYVPGTGLEHWFEFEFNNEVLQHNLLHHEIVQAATYRYTTILDDTIRYDFDEPLCAKINCDQIYAPTTRVVDYWNMTIPAPYKKVSNIISFHDVHGNQLLCSEVRLENKGSM